MNAGKSSGGTSTGGRASSAKSGTSTTATASKSKGSVSPSRGLRSESGAKPAKSSVANDGISLSKESKEKDATTGVNLGAWDDAGPTEQSVQTADQAKAETTQADEGKKGFNADLAASLGDKTLRSGMHDESVRSLQSALNDKLGLELGTDGKFGPKTKAAVKDFQRQNGLKPDGVVGPKTREKLLGGAAAAEPAKDKLPTGSDIPVPTPRPDQPQDKLPTGSDIPVPSPRPDQPTDKPAAGKPGEMSFGQKLSDGQKQAVNQMVSDLKAKGYDVKADDIVNFMAVETQGTFSPSIRSGGKKSGAVGLAQFTGTALTQMNKFRSKDNQLTKSKLAAMSFEEQSKVVTEYLTGALGNKMKGKSVSAGDLYTAVFAPAHVGKAAGATLYSRARNSRAYNANKSLDTNRDGVITKAELTARLDAWESRGAKLRG